MHHDATVGQLAQHMGVAFCGVWLVVERSENGFYAQCLCQTWNFMNGVSLQHQQADLVVPRPFRPLLPQMTQLAVQIFKTVHDELHPCIVFGQ